MLKFRRAHTILALFLGIFFLSLVTGFFVLEFRLAKKVMGEYENSLQQTALNKIQLFISDVRAFAQSAARKLARENGTTGKLLEEIARQNPEIAGVYLVGTGGELIASAGGGKGHRYQPSQAFARALAGETFVTGGESGRIEIGTPVYDAAKRLRGILIVAFTVSPFLQELTQEFLNPNYKVALLDNGDRPVVWPFDREKLGEFVTYQDKLYDRNFLRYNVGTARIDHTSWQMYLFLKDNNFDTYRVITIMFLLFVLYFCVYEFLVEFWKASSINSYFEDVNFTIFNHLKEGVLICNKFDRVVFANEAAHRFFADRMANLRGVALQDILASGCGAAGGESKKMILKNSGRMFEIVYSPIFKAGKVLGSLAVVSLSSDREKVGEHLLAKLVDLNPDGLVFVDKNHQVVMANMMANYYLGPLEKGRHLSEVSPRLATAVDNNIGSRSLNRIDIGLSGVACEIAAVYDEHGLYAGTLVFLRNAAGGHLPEGL
uniref:PAS domain-containing protein n=1 Tax=Ammonifex degensii TaxID=42838 RepID=A0A7C2HUQ1_9THEO